MEWIAMSIAVIAALAAVWQAAEARRANKGAGAHEAKALEAQQRVAEALERQAFYFTFIRRYSSPTSREVTIRWTEGDERRSYPFRVS